MYASIDVGTNTVRMLLGNVIQGKVVPERYLRRITRLGGDFDPVAGLSPLSMSRTLTVLKEFSAELKQQSVTAISAVATEAVRRAPNGHAFAAQVSSECVFDLEVISGELEAQLSFAGVLTALEPVPDHLLVFDIGGGSTEFVYVVSGNIRFSRSYPLGTVMLCEHHPGSVAQQAHIDRTLRNLEADMVSAGIQHPLPPSTVPVGTAGTVTTLAALDLQMQDYDWRRVNNYRMVVERLHQLLVDLEPMTVAAREQMPGMEKGRADLIVPGLRIVNSIIDYCHSSEMVVSDFGLLEGGLLRAAGTL